MKKNNRTVERMRSLIETLEITEDRKLFRQILQAAITLKDDVRVGKLHSFEEVFKDCEFPARRRG